MRFFLQIKNLIIFYQACGLAKKERKNNKTKESEKDLNSYFVFIHCQFKYS